MNYIDDIYNIYDKYDIKCMSGKHAASIDSGYH